MSATWTKQTDVVLEEVVEDESEAGRGEGDEEEEEEEDMELDGGEWSKSVKMKEGRK